MCDQRAASAKDLTALTLATRAREERAAAAAEVKAAAAAGVTVPSGRTADDEAADAGDADDGDDTAPGNKGGTGPARGSTADGAAVAATTPADGLTAHDSDQQAGSSGDDDPDATAGPGSAAAASAPSAAGKRKRGVPAAGVGPSTDQGGKRGKKERPISAEAQSLLARLASARDADGADSQVSNRVYMRACAYFCA